MKTVISQVYCWGQYHRIVEVWDEWLMLHRIHLVQPHALFGLIYHPRKAILQPLCGCHQWVVSSLPSLPRHQLLFCWFLPEHGRNQCSSSPLCFASKNTGAPDLLFLVCSALVSIPHLSWTQERQCCLPAQTRAALVKGTTAKARLSPSKAYVVSVGERSRRRSWAPKDLRSTAVEDRWSGKSIHGFFHEEDSNE